MRRAGYSLPELSIVVVVMAILSSVLINVTDGAVDSARYAKADGEIASLATAVTRYHYDMKVYPPALSYLTDASPYDGKSWIIAQMIPTSDPWGKRCGVNGSAGGTTAYCYSFTDSGFAIWTLGANGSNNSGGGGTTLPAAIASDDKGVFGK